MDTRTIQVLLREPGYLRLRLPAAARTTAVGATLEAGLKTLPGVLRTSWLTVEGKLAVRFDARLSHAEVARRIKALLPEQAPDALTADPEPMPAASLGEQFGDLRMKLIAATPARFQPMIESATTEKAVTNFFNDIVAFYLIRTHWDLIVERWLKEPVKYGNAWMTVFYLVYLLVRYRKS